MTDNAQRQIMVTLAEGDWLVIVAGLYELPMKQAVQTFNRVQAALAEAQKPPEIMTPHLVTGSIE